MYTKAYYWGVAEYASPKYATLAWWLFWPEGNWKDPDTRKASAHLEFV